MLQAQAAYGTNPVCIDLGPISLGRSLFATVPEDAHDHGPVVRGRHALAADIRIDNREELHRLLEIPGSRAAELSDAAILFEALLARGKGGLDLIVGEFALAFWDGAERKLLLARDVLGLRPLFYHRADGFFAFSSMPSGLHALPNVPYAFDAEIMAETLALMPQVGPKTFFRSIDRVEPAHFLEVSPSGVTSGRYWDPPRPTGKRLPVGEYEEGLRAVVDDATRAHLRGAGDLIASHLSGGLDSSIVVTSAARQMPHGKIVAYTSVPRRGFDGPIPRGVLADEADRAAATARLYPNVEHVIVENGEVSPIAALSRDLAYQQQPLPNLCNNVWGNTINRLARERGAKVLFMGNAGNLTVSYYGMQVLPALLRQGRLVKLARLFLAAGRNGYPWLSLGACTIGPYLPGWLWRLVSRRVTDLRQYAPIHPSRMDELNATARERRLDFSYPPRKDPVELRTWALSRFDNGSYFKGTLAQWGLSVRDPTADKRVIDFCLSVPPEEYIRDGMPRALARRAFGDRLPPEVANAVVRGYQAPDWYEGLGNDLANVREEVAIIGRCAEASNVMDVAWLQEAIDSWPTEGWERDDIVMRYRTGVLHGLSVGHFMRKVSGTN